MEGVFALMKRKWLAAAGAAVLILALAACAIAAGPARLIVDGREIRPDVPPQLINGRTMVPIRWVAEALGADVQWDARNNAVVINTNGQEPARQKDYPRVPEKITTPEMALQAYFDALSVASNLQPDQMGAAGGTVGMGLEPYPTAYGYWSKEWRDKHPYEEFVSSWRGTAGLELLKLLPAGTENGERRFFAEVKTIEAVGEKPRLGIFYSAGFFTVRETPEGWRITGGSLEPEKLGWKIGGHQPWLGDPEAVARAQLGGSIGDPLGEPVTENNPDGTVTVKFTDRNGNVNHQAVLVQREDGIWEVIDGQ